MDDTLEDRIDALERAITDGDHDLSGLAKQGEMADQLNRLETKVEQLETKIDDLDGATQALRGYVGNVRSVNRDVETTAETALSKVESLEARVDERSDRTPQEREQFGGSESGAVNTGNCSKPAEDWQKTNGSHQCTGTPTADGGQSEPHVETCVSCGRPRTDSVVSDGRKYSEETLFDPGSDADERFAADTDEMGTLERIRQLL